MKKTLKITAVLAVASLLFSLFGCGDKKMALQDYENWFINGFEAAYESYGKDNTMVMMSDDTIKMIFAFIKDGTKPVAGEITEKDGVYTYVYENVTEIFEFSSEKTAVRITKHLSDLADDRIEYVAVFAQDGKWYYLQFYMPDALDYTEVRFNEKEGSKVNRGGQSELPYDIFSSDIPSDFAKENEDK